MNYWLLQSSPRFAVTPKRIPDRSKVPRDEAEGVVSVERRSREMAMKGVGTAFVRLFDWCRSIDDGADLPSGRCRVLALQTFYAFNGPRFSLHAANSQGLCQGGFKVFDPR